MTETINWLQKIEERQDSASDPRIFWVSVFVLLIGVVGLLWSIPVPDEFFRISPALNWATALLMATLVYYFIISISLGIGMVPFLLGLVTLLIWLADISIPLAYTASVLIGIGVAGLSFGHFANGGLRAVLRDVQLVMIAPLWLLSALYRRLGIPY